MFVDAVKVRVHAGNGGRGCVAFLREAFRPKGGPCGGNGGKGGDVILEADANVNNLVNLHYQPHLRAKNGNPGGGKDKDGRHAKDLIVKVPCGTLIWKLLDTAEDSPNEKSGLPSENAKPQAASIEPDVLPDVCEGIRHHEDPELRDATLYGDLTESGQRFLLGCGGRGGLGNKNFATAQRQFPRFAQPGEAGTEGHFFLELRILADIGFVGYPNAGKSTLLAALSRARPKIADYPFTTLKPNIGIIKHEDFHQTTICDIPGIIEGAHENAGLGHAFLRHIKRCKALAYLVDIAGTDGRQPWDDYRQLRNELKAYDPSMLKRPAIILANKMDEPSASENLKRFKKEIDQIRIIPIAAAFDQGLDMVKQAFRKAAERSSKASLG
ncbi:MAG: GTPase Obg [Verrucomicrobia subdivision 3 bacterium]|nr:GTPase Obg [Limisphaerales bacterium]MCS1415875.1 GTPase Obg [Limisphaerales bacterium]